jgi:hypothetical protein
MSRTFEGMRTEAGMRPWTGLIRHTARELDLTIESHGAHSTEAANQHLILGLMHYLSGDFEGAEPHIWSYVTLSQQRYGSKSDELATGLILLTNNCIESRQWLHETRSVLEWLKSVSQRCPSRRDPLLEGVYDAAMKCQRAGELAGRQRGFILLLMALSWCVRHHSDTVIYEQFLARLETVFDPYGFVEDRWEWLVKHSNHNLHDIAGLTSVLLDKRILSPDGEPPLTAEMREEALKALVQEFPVCAERDLRQRTVARCGLPMKLQFRCPMCGSRDLRTMFTEPYYPISTLDGIVVDPSNVDLCDLIEREPSEYEGQGHTAGWRFWCDKCGLEPNLEPYEEDESQEESLARWLLDNCPQDVAPPASEDTHSG